MLKDVMVNSSMSFCRMRPLSAVLMALLLLACRDRGEKGDDSARGLLPPVYPSGPASSTNWDVDAGPVMLVSLGSSADSASVILPEVTDSTIASVQGNSAPVAGLSFDLFGRGGKVGGSIAVARFNQRMRNRSVTAGHSSGYVLPALVGALALRADMHRRSSSIPSKRCQALIQPHSLPLLPGWQRLCRLLLIPHSEDCRPVCVLHIPSDSILSISSLQISFAA